LVPYPLKLKVAVDDAGRRLDQFLVAQLPDVSRARLQQLIEQGQVRVNGRDGKASLKLRGNEEIEVLVEPIAPPLRAIPEDIPLDVVYEDEHLAVVNKPAGMMVHAGAGATDDARNRGTLVNALLHRFQSLSIRGGEARPGIVHRLDKQTSGLIIIAKDDSTHRRLAQQFAARQIHKTYIALVHGWLKHDTGTLRSPIGRDPQRRTRMIAGLGREAVTHYRVLKRIEGSLGKFTLVEVKIETGRTHQIRVHMAELGHPVVGDTLYGAPRELGRGRSASATLGRNFLHAAEIEFVHPQSGRHLALGADLPAELKTFLANAEKP
jgi:23S rRNA pseudouridine1911/1915/1917 synthase